MGRHEIRLRRKSMTSRRIERHKNYAGLMEQHRKTQRMRTILRWVVAVVIFLLGLMTVYYAVDKKNLNSSRIEKVVNEYVDLT